MKIRLLDPAAILLLVIATPTYSSIRQTEKPSITGEATYLSTQIVSGGIRSEIRVKDGHFTMKAVGTPSAGAGSHHGGRVSVTENSTFFYLEGIGIPIPKPNVRSWKVGNVNCASSQMTGEVISIVCDSTSEKQNFSYLVSRTKGVIQFTGMCFLNREQICQYVLASERGLSIK